MFKKLIFIIPVAIFTLISAPINTYACDSACPEGQETCENPCENDFNNLVTGTIAEPTGDTAEVLTTSENNDAAATPADELPEDTIAAISESNENVNNVENDETTAEKNPVIAKIEQLAEEKLGFTLNSETWPLVLSASALILTVILIIIINLVARSKARKATAKANHQDLANGLLDL